MNYLKIQNELIKNLQQKKTVIAERLGDVVYASTDSVVIYAVPVEEFYLDLARISSPYIMNVLEKILTFAEEEEFQRTNALYQPRACKTDLVRMFKSDSGAEKWVSEKHLQKFTGKKFMGGSAKNTPLFIFGKEGLQGFIAPIAAHFSVVMEEF